MFFVLAKAVQIGQDFFSSPQYELVFDYQHQPETTNILTVQNTICEIPSGHVSEVKPLDVNESLALINGMSCLHYIPTSSFWGYEFCIDKHLRQYHPAAKVVTKDNQFTLGLPENQKASIKYNQEYYIQLEWDHGTICDLSQKPRRSNINLYCGTFEKIKSIREVSTCFYELIVTTPKLCKKPFIPETDVPKIKCKLDQLQDHIPFTLVQYFKHQKGDRESKVLKIDAEPKVVFGNLFGKLLNEKSDLQVLNENLELQEQVDELLQSVQELFDDDVTVVIIDEDEKKEEKEK
ncbi:Protein OS-9 [Boothiomyces sp. JEL0838]|nr:Protein OS-9 [Boothiomyces sp. JEL0838]